MQIGFLALMFVLGACIGSFLCCQVRRLHYAESHKKSLGPRSVCMNCKKKLTWYENLPLISWLVQGGKCRKCKASIGYAEFLSELGTAVAFLMFGTTIDVMSAGVQSWVVFATTLALIISLAFLAIYDGTYGELPSIALYISIVLALVTCVVRGWGASMPGYPLDVVYSVSILGGVYFILYVVSKGKWVGDGDYFIGVALGLALGKPLLALVVLFLSNLIASFVMLPFVIHRPEKKIYFGPFLVIAYIIVITFSSLIESVIL